MKKTLATGMISVSLMMMFQAGCSSTKDRKDSALKASRPKLKKNFDDIQFEKDRSKLVAKKISTEIDSTRFKANPQNKKLDLYISGQHNSYEGALQLASAGKYGEALVLFNRVIKSNPKSERARLSMYQKAVLYHKMNLADQSKGILKDLIRQFPNSLEAKRAKLALNSM